MMSLTLDPVAGLPGGGGDPAATTTRVQQQPAAVERFRLKQPLVTPVRLDVEVIGGTYPNMGQAGPLDAVFEGAHTHY
jgi:hypothetical protein